MPSFFIEIFIFDYIIYQTRKMMDINKIAKNVFALQFPGEEIDRLIEFDEAETFPINFEQKDKKMVEKLLRNKLNSKLPKIAELVEAEGVEVEKTLEATSNLDAAIYLGKGYWIQCLLWGGYVFRYSDGVENTTFGTTMSSIRQLMPLIKSKMSGSKSREKKKPEHPFFYDISFGESPDEKYRAR